MLLGLNKMRICIIIAAFLISGCNIYANDTACFKDNCFSVEIAKDSKERLQGLMHREGLPKNKGMLFIFEKEDFYPFWMKNVSFPLDIIWLNSKDEVVFINKNSLPCKIEPCQVIEPGKKAMYVLEINAGLTDKIGLAIGDKLILNFKNAPDRKP